MAELRDIFRAEDGSEWHASTTAFVKDKWLMIYTGVGVGPIPIYLLKSTIEGPYKVWQEK